MSSTMNKYDPWGPISATLFSTVDSDLVQRIIDFTGVVLPWPALDDRTGYSHGTRLRAFRPVILEAYVALSNEEKGRFAQTVAKRLLESRIKDNLKREMLESLEDIGWTITDDGLLTTVDAILSEQFFPPGSPFDAYVAIRSILEHATRHVLVVDAYMGSTIFVTLRAVSRPNVSVELLTTDKALNVDFKLEANVFLQQFTESILEVRTTREFHDRFIVVDGSTYYHVGASIKDAGKRAFLISRLEDQPIIDLLKTHILASWHNATRVL